MVLRTDEGGWVRVVNRPPDARWDGVTNLHSK